MARLQRNLARPATGWRTCAQHGGRGRRRGGDAGEFSFSDAPSTTREGAPAAEPDWALRVAPRTAGVEGRSSLPHRLIRRLDAALRRFYGIYEFSDRPECLLRIAVSRCERDVRLAGGRELKRGAEILELHLWNEHLPKVEALGVGLGRLNALRGLIAASLYELADHLAAEPALCRVEAIQARAALVSRSRVSKLLSVARTYGFGKAEYVEGESLWRRFHGFCENFLICALAWTFNPAALRRNRLLRTRCELWVSRDAFIARYGPHSLERRRGPGMQASCASGSCSADAPSRRMAAARGIAA